MPHTYLFFLSSFLYFFFLISREAFPHAQVGTSSTFYIIPYLLSPDFVSQLRYLPTLHAFSFCFIVSREREREREGERGREKNNSISKSRSSLNFLFINHSRVVPDFRTLSLQCTRKDSDP